MNPSEIRSYFQENIEAITDSIREIVEIESPSFSPEGIGSVADWIEKRTTAAIPGASIERKFAESRGDHLIIRAFSDKPGKPVLILGHTDTVHPFGSTLKNPTRIEDGKLFGCGTFDMKANIALFIEVLGAMRKLGLEPARPLRIVLSCDEEVGSATGRPILEAEARKSDYCFIFEPSANGKIKTGRKGTGMYRLKAKGVPAHAGLDPEKGASAILELSKQIAALENLNDPSDGTTVTVGTIKGGTTTNVVPEFAECSIDVRFTSVEAGKRVESALRSLEPSDKRVELELEGEINRPPLERTEAVAALFRKTVELASSFGYEIGETQVGGASDGNFVGALGIPVLDGLGIRGDGAHRLDEHVVVEDIPDRAALITLLLSNEMSSNA